MLQAEPMAIVGLILGALSVPAALLAGRGLTRTDGRLRVGAIACVVSIALWFLLEEYSSVGLRLVPWDDFVYFQRVPLYFAILSLLAMCLPRLGASVRRLTTVVVVIFAMYVIAESAAPAALAGVTVRAAAAGLRRGYLVVGWLWFLGMLLPVVGLLPWGLRVMNDRYSYVPMIGLAVAISFGAADLAARFRVPRAVPIAAATAVLTLCAVLSWNQAGVWRDSLTLFDHALAVTERNAIVHFFKGNTLAASGDFDGAQREYESALAIHPRYPDAHDNLGRLHLEQGRGDLAIPYFERALEARPGWSQAMTNLGDALWASGERERALAIFQAVVAASPESADARYWLALAQHKSGRRAEAVAGYREALRIDPTHESALRGLARLRKRPE